MKRLAVVIVTLIGLVGFAALGTAEEPENKPDADEKESAEESPRMDVVFVVDATGSMQDEIDVIKKEVWNIANELMTGKPTPDIRFGLVLYRDKSDSKVIEETKLTRNVDEIHEKLMSARAMGGGDGPEHVGRGLHTALDMDWGGGDVSKTIYLVGDAPAKQYKEHTLATALSKSNQKGIKINSIGGSGIEHGGGKAEFAKISKSTGGSFQALTYYAVVEGEDGSKKSVVYHDGEMYEKDGEITEEEWKEGGEKVIEKHDMRRADRDTKRRARSAKKENNLDKVVEDDMKSSAEAMGVAY